MEFNNEQLLTEILLHDNGTPLLLSPLGAGEESTPKKYFMTRKLNRSKRVLLPFYNIRILKIKLEQ